MIKGILQSLEDPCRPLIGPNYWILKKIGLILPEGKLGKVFYIIIHQLVTLLVITQYMELYVIRSDLDLALDNLKISMVSTVCIVKVNTFLMWQTSWKEVLVYVTEADKFERNNKVSPRSQKILDTYTRYCRGLTYFYWGLIFITFWLSTLTPILKYFTSSTLRENVHNGKEGFPHILSSWMPLDKNHFPGSLITVLWQYPQCAYGAIIMGAYDTSVVVIMVFFGGKLDLLRERCAKMLGENGAGISDEEALRLLRKLHRIHVMLIKHSRLFNSLLSPVMFVYMVMCSFMLCASGFLLTNENVILGPYESNWSGANLQRKKDILLLTGQFRIQNIFTAGPFANLTLPTFVTILKGAYSYYTFLRN